jgi:hypothetical protein
MRSYTLVVTVLLDVLTPAVCFVNKWEDLKISPKPIVSTAATFVNIAGNTGTVSTTRTDLICAGNCKYVDDAQTRDILKRCAHAIFVKHVDTTEKAITL